MGSIDRAPHMRLDVLVVGAGFGGIYALYTLRKLGLKVHAIDKAQGVGGTWFWNTYPGAMSDTESSLYRFTWDKDDLQSYPWPRSYVRQPEVLAYLEHVVQKHDLMRDISLDTEMVAAGWNDINNHWLVSLASGETITSRYIVPALGLLSKQNYPDIPGIEANVFKGQMIHSAAWPKDLSVAGKKVALIGCGSTGVQIVTEIAKDVESLTCFQRHPQYSTPSGDTEVSPEARDHINKTYDSLIERSKSSITGFGFEESKLPFSSFAPEEREAIFEKLWNTGGGFQFMFGGFSDISTNEEANKAACEFIRGKIRAIVTDPEKARKLQPHDLYARRPLCDGGYYKQFNRENVDLIDLLENPIEAVTTNGIRTSDGTEHNFDIIIFATGFDAVDGNYNRTTILGRQGLPLKKHWEAGPTSYLGLGVPGFPNLFMLTGPSSAFSNIPPCLEIQMEFIRDLIMESERRYAVAVEATPEAEKAWDEECDRISRDSLFRKADSWIFGSNVPGKVQKLRFYFGGLGKYRQKLQELRDNDFLGFNFM